MDSEHWPAPHPAPTHSARRRQAAGLEALRVRRPLLPLLLWEAELPLDLARRQPADLEPHPHSEVQTSQTSADEPVAHALLLRSLHATSLLVL